MGFLSRLRNTVIGKPSVQQPDDSDMAKSLSVARLANKKASEILNDAVKKQEKDALFVRQVISDVLERNEKGKANAGNR